MKCPDCDFVPWGSAAEGDKIEHLSRTRHLILKDGKPFFDSYRVLSEQQKKESR